MTAIETAAIIKCADAVSGNYGWINGVYYDDLAEGLLTLIPQDGHTALEQKCMEAADAALRSEGIHCGENYLRAIALDVIGAAK